MHLPGHVLTSDILIVASSSLAAALCGQRDTNGLESVIGVAQINVCGKFLLGPVERPPNVKDRATTFVCCRGKLAEHARRVWYPTTARSGGVVAPGVEKLPREASGERGWFFSRLPWTGDRSSLPPSLTCPTAALVPPAPEYDSKTRELRPLQGDVLARLQAYSAARGDSPRLGVQSRGEFDATMKKNHAQRSRAFGSRRCALHRRVPRV